MENKTSKYFKYAIGEIVLVVIGILIALQINTWNEARITAKNTLIIGKRLLNETKLNSKDLKIDIERVSSSKNSAFTLLKLMGKDYTRYDKKRVDSLLLKIYSVYNHNFNAAVLDKIMNTGEIANFKNDSIEIVAYGIKTQINKYKLSETLLQTYSINISNFWFDKVSIRQLDFNFSDAGKTNGPSQVAKVDNRAILGSLVFENLVDDSYYLYETLETNYTNLDDNLKLFAKLLEKEIGKKNDKIL